MQYSVFSPIHLFLQANEMLSWISNFILKNLFGAIVSAFNSWRNDRTNQELGAANVELHTSEEISRIADERSKVKPITNRSELTAKLRRDAEQAGHQ